MLTYSLFFWKKKIEKIMVNPNILVLEASLFQKRYLAPPQLYILYLIFHKKIVTVYLNQILMKFNTNQFA